MNPQSDVASIAVRVTARRPLTGSICEFELRDASEMPLPPFRAGGSLIVDTPSGERRNYSIVNDERETDRYLIAVKHEVGSRGGSRSMHQAAPVGSLLRVQVARNGLFAGAGARHLLIAGGIGITPLLSLARTLARASDRSFRLIYLARSREEAAYVDELERAPLAPHVTLHFSSERRRRIDLGPLLRDNADGTHLYYCGPAPLMERVRLLSIHWPRSRVHAESFDKASGTLRGGEPFRVLQTRTGRVFDIGEDETILEALRRQGLQPPASCESGTCGTCRMRLVAGMVDHQDMYLTADERRSAIMPCVSRGIGTIELDF